MARRPRRSPCGTVVAPDREIAGIPCKARHFGCRERLSHRRSAAHWRAISVDFRDCTGQLGLPGGGGESRTAVPTNDRRDEVAPVFHHRHVVRSLEFGSGFPAIAQGSAGVCVVSRLRKSASPRAGSASAFSDAISVRLNPVHFQGLPNRASCRKRSSVSEPRKASTSARSSADSSKPAISGLLSGLARPSPAFRSPDAITRPPAA